MADPGQPPGRPRGHVFVVHGRLETVVHDAVVVPTDAGFAVEAHWAAVHGAADHAGLAALRPTGWPGRGHGRAADGRAVWFVDVGDPRSPCTETLVERTVAAVAEVAEADLVPSHDRSLPVLVLPVLGLEGGGHDRDRGGVLRGMLAALQEVVAGLPLDVALVTPEPSVYAAAQHLRAGAAASAVLDEQTARTARRLGGLARRGELALLLGAGVSIPAGLPAWRPLLRCVAERSGRFGDVDLDRLSPPDQAELLSRRLPDVGALVAEICRQHDRPSLAHALLAGLDARRVVTTNYDRLWEDAVAATGRSRPRALPWEHALGADSWVLKVHGDVGHPDSIVLTRRDFLRFDALARPAGALLQGLLMTHHLLVVGASMSDDNLVRLTDEVQVYREDHDLEGALGTVLDVVDDRARGELWRDRLDWVTLPGSSAADRARALEVLLDLVGLHAADDTPWLLDPRFTGLLDEQDRPLADEARRLRARLAPAGREWCRLVEALDALGAAGGTDPPAVGRTGAAT